MGLPFWFSLKGEIRARYETLDEQFRARLEGSDQVLALRSSLLMEADLAPVQVTAEILDARQLLADSGSALDTTTVNTLELLQAHLEWDLGTLGKGRQHLRLGRETVNLGSRRLMARNAFRNTINAYTGADWRWETKAGHSVRAMWLLPNQRQPDDLTSLQDNDSAFDDQDFDLQFWALYATLPLPPVRAELELYAFGLHESGSGTRHRQLYTPGFRLVRKPETGQVDFEAESALQLGTSSSSVNGSAISHQALFLHLSVGYSANLPWRPRLGLAYDYASGDRKPDDGDNNRFDTLYGARRFEYGPTGSYGAIARSNLSSPELRLDFTPAVNTEFMIAHRGVWLASGKDAWTAAGVRDASGRSGKFVGQQLEARLRWDAIPGNLRVETGIAQIFPGRFQESAPNGKPSDTTYAYFEMTWWF
ncbi:alginate export family protein [Prosthecobacter sp. SYSU 5D2]|uniref:alginate export family protein n=1 Tax=Prosthecobacter sp. SYSU 5D2 TaxID=3134134 RepID=UPI0031FE5CD4